MTREQLHIDLYRTTDQIQGLIALRSIVSIAVVFISLFAAFSNELLYYLRKPIYGICRKAQHDRLM